MRLLNRPLLRFALLGALLFAADFLWSARNAPAPVPAPGAAGAGAALPGDDELLFQEALARGWHRSDAIVRRRLARNMRFALEGGAAGGEKREDAALVREAIALGMHRSDRVVRRRLVQKLRLQIHARARAQEPSEAELAAYLARHAARWTEPARRSLTQLYFRKLQDAEAALPSLPALSALSNSPAPNAKAKALRVGDALPLPRHLAGRSRSDLERLFGPDFAAAAFDAPDAMWSGPIASSYGYHLVWIHGRRAAVLSKLSVVRPEVREALLYQRGQAALRSELAALRARARANGAPDPR